MRKVFYLVVLIGIVSCKKERVPVTPGNISIAEVVQANYKTIILRRLVYKLGNKTSPFIAQACLITKHLIGAKVMKCMRSFPEETMPT